MNGKIIFDSNASNLFFIQDTEKIRYLTYRKAKIKRRKDKGMRINRNAVK